MAEWCVSCGQALPDDAPADAHAPGTAGAAGYPVGGGAENVLAVPDDSGRPALPSGEQRTGMEKKVLLAVGAVVVVWVAFVALGRLVAPDDSIDDQVAADSEAARIEQAVAEALQEAESARRADEVAEANAAAQESAAAPADAALTDANGGDDGGAGVPGDGAGGAGVAGDGAGGAYELGSDRPMSSLSMQASRLRRQLVRRNSRPFVAYQSALGVVVLDLAGGTSRVQTVDSDTVAAVPGAQLLRTGADTFAIDPDTLQAQHVGQDSSLVVADTLDGNTYFVGPDALAGQASTVEVVADGTPHAHRMPAGGFQLLAIDGLGLLAVPKGPTGETLIARTDDFAPLSDNRVLTGTASALLEQVCTTEATCSLVLTDVETSEQSPIPANFVRFGDQYVVAPDGGSLLRISPEGFAEVFVTSTDSIAWVVGAGMREPAWGPNSDFIAWLDRIGEPKLKVMFPDERDWLSLPLADLGAPPPTDDDLIVFEAALAPEPPPAG